MMTVRRTAVRCLSAIAAAVAALLSVLSVGDDIAIAQATRTIKLIVPSPPGASTDTIARIMAEELHRANGVTVVVEDRPGASGMIGTEFVSRATPDGNTLLVSPNQYLIDAQMRHANYHPVSSFAPVCLLVEAPPVLIVNAASTYRTLADLVDAAKAKPGVLTMAALGPGSVYQIGFLKLLEAAQIRMTFVPYPGSAPAVTALLGEHVTSAMAGTAVVAEQIKAGKLRALAAATAARIATLADVPTLTEAGFKDLVVENWFGIVAPAKTPSVVLTQLAGWFTAALQNAEIREKLVAQELHPSGLCGDDFAAMIRKRYDEYGRVIREMKLQTE